MTLAQLNRYLDHLEYNYVDTNQELVEKLTGLPFYCDWLPLDSPEPIEQANDGRPQAQAPKQAHRTGTGTHRSQVIGTGTSGTKNSSFKYTQNFKNKPRTLIQNNCCFNHAIGLPEKSGKKYPLFDYEQQLFDTLQSKKLVYLLKATGLGITEFMIRYIAWVCLKDDKLKGSQIIIVTGPRLEKSVEIIQRMKNLFIHSELVKSFASKMTVVYLNGIRIEAMPSDHLDDARGIPNVSFIYIDEADFFSPKEQANLRDVTERYLIKSSPWIVLTSTPNKPDNIMDQIKNEKKCIYERLYFDYTVAINKMWSPAEIELQMQSPSFQREYNLKFLGQIGNLFPTHAINSIVESYPLNEVSTTSMFYPRWCGIDPGYSSSMFGICVVQWKDDRLEVVFTASLNKPLYTDTLALIRQLVQKYHICKVFVDGSAAHLIHELKHGYDEYVQYERLKPELLETYIRNGCREPLIVPVNFQKHHKDLLKHTQKAIAKRRVRIHPSHEQLITALRSATTKSEYDLDKQNTINDDLFDAFRMSLLCLRSEGE